MESLLHAVLEKPDFSWGDLDTTPASVVFADGIGAYAKDAGELLWRERVAKIFSK
ncbi:hypothetical protein [Solidesulfovibrio carbinoliphilus]|uniref:hypothetical protein n=1 Tax=Solidesulfovibrio carbinoliphilus TaxID=345370 RepID=UPI0012F50E4C|nr:hypothetical protein [Solidesulfovibrio carbinoliphilus]